MRDVRVRKSIKKGLGKLMNESRQLLSRPVVRTPVVHSRRYTTGEEFRQPVDWAKTVEFNRHGLWIELPDYLAFPGHNIRRNNL